MKCVTSATKHLDEMRYLGLYEMFLTEYYPKNSEAYSEPCQTSKMERFLKIFNGLTIFAKHSILDIWQRSEHASGICSQVFYRIVILKILEYF